MVMYYSSRHGADTYTLDEVGQDDEESEVILTPTEDDQEREG